MNGKESEPSWGGSIQEARSKRLRERRRMYLKFAGLVATIFVVLAVVKFLSVRWSPSTEVHIVEGCEIDSVRIGRSRLQYGRYLPGKYDGPWPVEILANGRWSRVMVDFNIEGESYLGIGCDPVTAWVYK